MQLQILLLFGTLVHGMQSNWDCPLCTYTNHASSKCEMCETQNPKAKSMVQTKTIEEDFDGLKWALEESMKTVDHKQINKVVELEDNVLNGNRLIVKNRKWTAETNSNDPDPRRHVHEEDVFQDAFPKPESKKSRKRIIDDLVTYAEPLKRYGWTNENIIDSITQNYDYERVDSAKIRRCKEWIDDALENSQNDAMNNMQVERNAGPENFFDFRKCEDPCDFIHLENILKNTQCGQKIKETTQNGNQLINLKDFNDKNMNVFDSNTDALKSYKMKVDARKPEALVDKYTFRIQNKFTWRLKNNFQGLNLTPNSGALKWPIERTTVDYLTLCEQMRVGQTCAKLYNKYCANNQYFTVSTSLTSKCECRCYGQPTQELCQCYRTDPFGFYSMPSVDEFDKIYISLYNKGIGERNVEVELCLEDEFGVLKKYKTFHRKIDFEIWKLPGKNRFKVVKGSGWDSEPIRAKNGVDCQGSGRFFKVENRTPGQKHKPIEMEIHFYKNQ